MAINRKYAEVTEFFGASYLAKCEMWISETQKKLTASIRVNEAVCEIVHFMGAE